MTSDLESLYRFLEDNIIRFSNSQFIENDPIQIPKKFFKKQDIEISAFLTAMISWGQRRSIINSAQRLLKLMEDEPYEFILRFNETDHGLLKSFYYRTLNGQDLLFILSALQLLYFEYADMEDVFYQCFSETGNIMDGINCFRSLMLRVPHLPRSRKHLADPASGSHAKRILMFLRWMIRRDPFKVDLGIWTKFSPSVLVCPLDVNTGRAARYLTLIKRKQDDRKAAEELTANLKLLDPKDPVRYDIALFNLGRPENKLLLAHAPLFSPSNV